MLAFQKRDRNEAGTTSLASTARAKLGERHRHEAKNLTLLAFTYAGFFGRSAGEQLFLAPTEIVGAINDLVPLGPFEVICVDFPEYTLLEVIMPRVLVTASFDENLLARQTPHASGCWEDYEFLFAPDGDPVDAWLVYDDLQQPMTQVCPPANTLLITGEPASLRQYRSRYTGQFGQVWSSHTTIQHPHTTLRNEAQHWHYGLWSGSVHGRALDYDDLVALQPPAKPKLLSVLCSSKSLTADHRRRLEFVQYLQAELGEQIDVFGSGIRSVADKSEAIWPYKYHIVLENDHSDHFMTEKLPDAFLGWSYPLYFGGSEAYHRFPEGSFTAIDIYQPEKSLNLIRNVLASDTYEQSLERIAEARNNVLVKHNLFAMLVDYWRVNLVKQSASAVTLLPKSHRASLVVQQLKRSLVGRAA